VSAVSTRTRQAYEELGLIREHLTGLHGIAAQIEDPALILHARGALHMNTLALQRVNLLLQSDLKSEGGAGSDLDGQSADASRWR
jgi:hypothetical protein